VVITVLNELEQAELNFRISKQKFFSSEHAWKSKQDDEEQLVTPFHQGSALAADYEAALGRQGTPAALPSDEVILSHAESRGMIGKEIGNSFGERVLAIHPIQSYNL
jgi:hypothetical protein